MKYTNAQILLAVHCRELGLKPEFEYRFCQRRWAFDLAIPDLRLALECNGGRWTGGHFRGKAVDAEYEKLNTAQMLGWRVLQFTNEFAEEGAAKAFIEKWLSTDQISDSGG